MTYQQIPNVRVWEQGRDYVEAAEILFDYNRIQPAAIMAGLAIEVFIKSFLAIRQKTGHAITDHGHGLSDLFKRIDSQTQAELLTCSSEVDASIDFLSELKKHDDVFVSARYWYEPTALLSLGSDTIYFARHACDSVFLLGQKRGV
jgi:HEPN domain-containing protein